MEKILNEILNELKGIKSDVTGLKSDFTGLKSDVKSLKSDVTSLKSDVTSLKSDFKSLKSDVNELKENQTLMQIQLKEHGDLLSALKTASEFHKADIDNLTHEVANIAGSVKSIESAVTKGEEAYNYVQGMKNLFITRG